MRVLIIHTPEGGFEVITDEPADVISVCDWVPSDRLYRMTDGHTVSAERVNQILADDPIGSADDERHPAIKGRIEAHIDGRRHLEVVK
jgi:hypothetical protein